MLRKADLLLVVAVLLVAVVALAFGQWFIAEAPISLSRDISPLNPRLFPNLVLVGVVVVAGLFITSRVRGIDDGGADSDAFLESVNAGGRKRLVAFLALVIVCALALNSLGFLTTMFALMVGTSLLVGNDNVSQVVGFSVGLPLLIYILVTHVLRTSLPELDALESVLAPLLAMLPSF